MLATPKPNVTLVQLTDPPYCCYCDQEWGETMQTPLLFGDGQDPSKIKEAPSRSDKLLNPTTKLSDPAPSLADKTASQASVHGECVKIPWPKQEYFEVPPPAPNIHAKTGKRQLPIILWGNTNTSTTTILLWGDINTSTTTTVLI